MIRLYSLLVAVLTAILMMVAVPPAEAQSADTLYRMARSGDVNAMRKLGVRLYNGTGVSRNLAYAAGWFKKAAARGDARSMAYLGDMYKYGKYFPKNELKARELYEQAARMGDARARRIVQRYSSSLSSEEDDGDESLSADPDEAADDSKLTETRQNPTAASGTAKVIAPGTAQVARGIAAQIAGQAATKNVKSIAVVSFQTNGGTCDALTSNTRSLLLEELSNNYGQSVALFDREDSKAVATESGFSMDGEQLASTQAILVAEVFHAPGDSIGYISYRLFRSTDTEILDAGFYRVRWSDEEKRMFSGSSYAPLYNSLPYIEQSELDKITAGFRRINFIGVAMGQSGALSAENTLQKRMAYAQIMPAILQGGGKLYEREFFVQAARESSLSNLEAMPGHAGALGLLRSGISGNDSNTYKLQISAIPQGNLLCTITFSQKAGRGVGQVGHSGENDFNDFMDQLDAENRNVQLVYEYEVIISDDYEVPKEFRGVSFGCVGAYCRSFAENNNSGKVPAQSILKEIVREWYQTFNGDRRQIQQHLTAAAIAGCRGEKGTYMGPLSMCIEKAQQTIQFTSGCESALSDPVFDIHDDLLEHPQTGIYEYDGKVIFTYTTSVEYKNGLPWRVKARVDFTPSKSIIIKRQNKP